MIIKKLSSFYGGSTVAFDVTLSIDNITQDISGDTVEIFFFSDQDDPDESAVLHSTAGMDRASDGIAEFTLSATDTNIAKQRYYYEIRWTSSTAVYKTKDTVTVL